MVRMLSVNEAMPMSRSGLLSSRTRSTSQPKREGRVGGDEGSLRTQQHRLT